MSESSWLDYWGLKYNPFIDFPVGTKEFRQFTVSTKNTKKIKPEIQTILNSPVGAIRLVVGSKGSGKTSWLSSLLFDVSKSKNVFSIYIDMCRSLDVIKQVGKASLMVKYVLNEIMLEILAKLRTVAPSLFKKQDWLGAIAKNVVTIPTVGSVPAISVDNFMDTLGAVRTEEYDTFVIAVDEIDKLMTPGDPDFEKLVNMVCDFFGTQQGFFRRLSTDNRVTTYISCDETLVAPLKRRNLSYLEGRVIIERLDPEETKRIVEARLKPQTEKSPFSPKSIETLVSFFQGNARRIIVSCEALMREAAILGLTEITPQLVKRLYYDIAKQTFEKDFQDIAINAEGLIGAKMFCRLGSRIKEFEDRKQILAFIASVYIDKEAKTPTEPTLEFLTNREYVVSSRGLKKVELNSYLISFLDLWKKKGHSIHDFVDWYSDSPVVPEELAQIEKKIQSIIEMHARNQKICKMIFDAYDIYAYALDCQHHNQKIVNKSWTMLENLINAQIRATRVPQHLLAPPGAPLMTHYSVALQIRRTHLNGYNSIKWVKKMRDRVQHPINYFPTDKEARNAKNNAKMDFEEIISKW